MANTDLKQADFVATFNFTRPVPAQILDATGAAQTIAIDLPRFDHAEDGTPLGLRIGKGAQFGQGDAAQLKEVALPEPLDGQPATILHRFSDDTGAEHRRAYFTRNAHSLVNALLATDVWHAELGVISGFLPNRGAEGTAGHVRYRQNSWDLPVLLGDGAGGALSDNGDRALLGG